MIGRGRQTIKEGQREPFIDELSGADGFNPVGALSIKSQSLVARVDVAYAWMRTDDDERLATVRGRQGHVERDPPAERIANPDSSGRRGEAQFGSLYQADLIVMAGTVSGKLDALNTKGVGQLGVERAPTPCILGEAMQQGHHSLGGRRGFNRVDHHV